MGIKLGNLQTNKHARTKKHYIVAYGTIYRKIIYKMHIHEIKLFRITKNGRTIIVCIVQSRNYNPKVKKISIRNSKDKHYTILDKNITFM